MVTRGRVDGPMRTTFMVRVADVEYVLWKTICLSTVVDEKRSMVVIKEPFTYTLALPLVGPRRAARATLLPVNLNETLDPMWSETLAWPSMYPLDVLVLHPLLYVAAL